MKASPAFCRAHFGVTCAQRASVAASCSAYGVPSTACSSRTWRPEVGEMRSLCVWRGVVVGHSMHPIGCGYPLGCVRAAAAIGATRRARGTRLQGRGGRAFYHEFTASILND